MPNMATVILTLLVLSPAIVAARSVTSGKLVELSSEQELYGKYASEDGTHGIIFNSRADGHLLIKNLAGESIVKTGPFYEAEGKKVRSVFIKNHEYLQHDSPAHSDLPVNHDTPLSHALQKILSMREISLLIEAAKAVAEQKGLTGSNTPAAMPFFMFAVRVTQLHTEGSFNTTSSRTKRELGEFDCLRECPPCPEEECYGLCGYGCWCLPFLCGDCCMHIGCYYHDACCRQDFYQTRCLLPYDFACEAVYSY